MAIPRRTGADPQSMSGHDSSVVVCSFSLDRWSELCAAIDSLLAQDVVPREIIIVVDHNAELFDRAQTNFSSPVRILENQGEPGLSDARNTGVAAASAPIIVFLDDDAVAEKRWLGQILRHYSRQEVIGVGGSAVADWVAGRPSWFPVEFDWVVGCSYRGMPTELSTVRNLLGCNMSFRRSAFNAGGFDNRIGRVGSRPVGCEETEFCIRVTGAIPGSSILYEPAALVRHRVPADRSSWHYFARRCYSEGLSKALVSRVAGRRAGLQSERRYASRTLPAGAARGLLDALGRRDTSGLGRVAAIIAGFTLTAAGFLAGSASIAVRNPMPGRSSTHVRLPRL
jgi:GT2 family glycosyltransferase